MPQRVEQSLLDQLQLHSLEISRRKELLDFNAADCAALLKVRPILLPEIDGIVDEFYEKQLLISEIALIIGDRETMRRLRAAQKQYIDDLFSGVYNEDYVNNRLRIGLVHKRIGVEPKYYLSAIKSLKDSLRNAIKRTVLDRAVAAETMEALDKLMYLDTEFVFETYIRSLLSEIEAAKEKAVQYATSLEEKVAERTEELARLSRVDVLTGMLNRRAFFEDFRKELVRAKRNSSGLSVLYFDIDGFKALNDAEGHGKGDAILARLAQAFSDCTRETDIAARIGGDEFCVVLPGSDDAGAQAFQERLVGGIEMAGLQITLSVGFAATGPDEYEEPETLVDMADRKMYESKNQGHLRNQLAE